MNILEYEMIEMLKVLKEKHDVFEIKAEYENEGTRETELMRLKELKIKTSNLLENWRSGSYYRYI